MSTGSIPTDTPLLPDLCLPDLYLQITTSTRSISTGSIPTDNHFYLIYVYPIYTYRYTTSTHHLLHDLCLPDLYLQKTTST